jgi:hypothetical protein
MPHGGVFRNQEADIRKEKKAHGMNLIRRRERSATAFQNPRKKKYEKNTRQADGTRSFGHGRIISFSARNSHYLGLHVTI